MNTINPLLRYKTILKDIPGYFELKVEEATKFKIPDLDRYKDLTLADLEVM